MKIGIVTHYMPPHIGGIELVADSLYRAYREAGLDARWVAAREPETAAARENGRVRVSCWNGLERSLGVPWPLLGLEGLREIARLVRWADLIHVHDCLYFGSSAATLLARRARKPVILSQHIGFVEYPSAILNGVERLANHTLGRAVLRGATHIVFCTSAAKTFVESLINEAGSKASLIPNGIDTDCFKPATMLEREAARKDLNLLPGARVALFVGRLVEKKGIDVLVELVQRLPSDLFLIVGDGPLKTRIPANASNIAWLPELAPRRMADIYKAADVFLLPSHGEGLPLSVQEAMASGLPVIVSQDEQFASMLQNEGACLATERTAEAFHRSLKTLADDHHLSSRLSARARERAVREWSLGVMTARYEHLINELTGKA